MAISSNYDRNVFINCPFDDDYKPMFEAIVFVILDCGFVPRCALETLNAGQTRIDKIVDIIRDCRLGVHDISNTELDKTNHLPRFNMPLELGLFIGCARYGSGRQKGKSCIVFDKEEFRYQKFISDVAGQDVTSHEANIDQLVTKIRNWLQTSGSGILPGGTVVGNRYKKFRAALPAICEGLELREVDMTFQDLCHAVETYLTAD